MVMPCFFRRLLETFIISIIVSIPCGILYTRGMIPATRIPLLLAMGASGVTVIAVTVYVLRSYYFFVKNRLDYFAVNLSVYLIFFVVNILIYKLCSIEMLSWNVYTVMYFIYRFFEVFRIPIFYSTLLVHAVMLLVIFIAPFELYRMMDVMRTISRNNENS